MTDSVLLCSRADGRPPRISTAVKRPCARCGVLCWVSPASAATVAAKDAAFVIACVECGVPEVEASMRRGDLEMMPPSAMQMQEMEQAGAQDVNAQKLHALAQQFIRRNSQRN